MPSVGDLFVNLGIKGSDKTVGQLAQTKSGMGELKSMSLETKAAILGVIYGFEQLISTSARMGMTLRNASTLLGIPDEVIQRYAYAGRKSSATTDEVIASFQKLQAISSALKQGGALPAPLQQLANYGMLDVEKLKAGDLSSAFQAMQRAALAPLTKDLITPWLLTIFPQNVAAGLEQGNFRQNILNQFKPIPKKTIDKAADAQAALNELQYKVQTMFTELTAKHGKQMVDDIAAVLPPLTNLINALIVLSDKLHAFEVIGKIISGWGLVFDTLADDVTAITGTAQQSAAARQRILERFEGKAPSPAEALAQSRVSNGPIINNPQTFHNSTTFNGQVDVRAANRITGRNMSDLAEMVRANAAKLKGN